MDVIERILSLFSWNADQYRTCISVLYLISENRGTAFLLRELLEDCGYGNDIYGYNFPDTYDPLDSETDEYFESGIQFYFHDEQQVVPYPEFVKLLNEFVRVYVKSGSQEIRSLLDMVSVKLLK